MSTARDKWLRINLLILTILYIILTPLPTHPKKSQTKNENKIRTMTLKQSVEILCAQPTTLCNPSQKKLKKGANLDMLFAQLIRYSLSSIVDKRAKDMIKLKIFFQDIQ